MVNLIFDGTKPVIALVYACCQGYQLRICSEVFNAKKREVNVEASLLDKTDRREYGIKERNRRIYERVKTPNRWS